MLQVARWLRAVRWAAPCSVAGHSEHGAMAEAETEDFDDYPARCVSDATTRAMPFDTASHVVNFRR